MSEMQADVEAALTGTIEAQRTLADVEAFVRQVRDDLARPSLLPAPALTEDAIVAALKADPAMAGRVMVGLGFVMSTNQVRELGDSAHVAAGSYTGGLQRLAVALAAASYRG